MEITHPGRAGSATAGKCKCPRREWSALERCDMEEAPKDEVAAATIYGTRTPLPDGRDSREYLAHLRELESEAKAAKRGAFGARSTYEVLGNQRTGYTQRGRTSGNKTVTKPCLRRDDPPFCTNLQRR